MTERSPGFRRALLAWALGAALSFAVIALILAASPDAVYAAAGAGALLFCVCLLIGQAGQPARTGGEELAPGEARWMLVIRLLLSSGGAFVLTYYFSDRMGLDPWLAGVLIPVCLFAGNLILSFIRYRIVLYLIFGLLTTVVSIVTFGLMNLLLTGTVEGYNDGYTWIPAKAVSWICAVLFAFFTNRAWVFEGEGSLISELVKFVAARAGSGLVVEAGGLFVLVNLLHLSSDLANVLVSIIVVIVNYFLSKGFVFTKGADT